MTLLKLNNVNKSYYTLKREIKALENISFEINESEIIGIIGPSGCGKSTILNIITELDNNYTGTIKKSNNLKIGYMMQNEACLPWINNFNNAILGLKLQKKYSKEKDNFVKELFKKYKLDNFLYDYPNNLSGGMKQRLALIRTLAIEPNLLLLDEPFSKLDVENKKNISNDIYNTLKLKKISCLIISHDIKEVINICDKIIVLSSSPGKIIKIIDNPLKDIKLIDRIKDNNYNNLYNSIKELIK